MTEEKILPDAFKLNAELIDNINTMNFENLKNNFGINTDVFEEIKEELFEYY